MDEFRIKADMTMHGALAGAVAVYRDQEALVCGETRVTWFQLGEKVNALAAGLQQLGLTKGEKVVFVLYNSPEFVYHWFGVGQAGGIVVPVNPYFRRRELQHVLGESEAEFVVLVPNVMGHDLLSLVQELRPGLPHLRQVIVHADSAPAGCVTLASVMQAGGEPKPVDVGSDDIFGLIYTSGTTGMPKAVVHSQRSMVEPIMYYQRERLAQRELPVTAQMAHIAKLTARWGTRFLKYGQKQRTNLTLTPFHAMAGYGSMRGTPLEGVRLVTMERFHPVRALELVQEEEVNVLVGTPSMYKLMLQVPDLDGYEKGSLLNCVIGGAFCPPALAREVKDRFNAPLTLPFGATETGTGLAQTGLTDSEELMTETVGRVHEHIQVKIVDDQHRPMPLGQVGEVVTKTPGQMVGYYKAPELNAQALDAEGWYYTGDLGTLDAKGYLRIVGRKKDVIIRGGQNIYPAEVEAYLCTHPAVQDAAVVGVPSELEGERVWAFVQPREGATLTGQDLLEYLRKEIAAFKVPSEVRIVPDLPRTSTQKVQKFLLRERAVEELAGPARG